MEGLSEDQVVAIKCARLSDYNGKSINAGDEHSQIYINPNNKRTKELQEWYKINKTNSDNYGQIGNTSSYGAQNGNNNTTYDKPDNFKLIKELMNDLNSDNF